MADSIIPAAITVTFRLFLGSNYTAQLAKEVPSLFEGHNGCISTTILLTFGIMSVILGQKLGAGPIRCVAALYTRICKPRTTPRPSHEAVRVEDPGLVYSQPDNTRLEDAKDAQLQKMRLEEEEDTKNMDIVTTAIPIVHMALLIMFVLIDRSRSGMDEGLLVMNALAALITMCLSIPLTIPLLITIFRRVR